MRTIINVPDYDPAVGLPLEWDDDFEILVQRDGHQVTITANAAGLRSLARHLLALAQQTVPAHSHLHFDSSNSLEEGSVELIVERV